MDLAIFYEIWALHLGFWLHHFGSSEILCNPKWVAKKRLWGHHGLVRLRTTDASSRLSIDIDQTGIEKDGQRQSKTFLRLKAESK